MANLPSLDWPPISTSDTVWAIPIAQELPGKGATVAKRPASPLEPILTIVVKLMFS